MAEKWSQHGKCQKLQTLEWPLQAGFKAGSNPVKPLIKLCQLYSTNKYLYTLVQNNMVLVSLAYLLVHEIYEPLCFCCMVTLLLVESISLVFAEWRIGVGSNNKTQNCEVAKLSRCTNMIKQVYFNLLMRGHECVMKHSIVVENQMSASWQWWKKSQVIHKFGLRTP